MDTSLIPITLNSENFSILIGKTLADLLMEHDIVSAQGIAVAVNMQVIPKEEWSHSLLHSGDNILIITAAQGG